MNCVKIDDSDYKVLLREMDMKTGTYEDVALDWEEKPDEWYHAIIADVDLSTVFSIPNLKIYSYIVSLKSCS